MSHGLANTLTLYDDNGNPVTVRLVNGEYHLVTCDIETHQKLDEIQLLLTQLTEQLSSR